MAIRGGRQRASGKRTSWWQTAAALLPCAMIAGAWGAAVAMPSEGGPVDSAAYSAYAEESPDVPVTGPDLAVNPGQDPVEQQSSVNGATPAGLTSAPSDIPATALAAYQRAASVMASTKPECKLSWELLAAIGRVESNHGQFGGSTVTATGATSRPILGLPLNGTNNTARIADTDKGAWDGDTKWDRAVGPMQFIPSTWSAVGVDADGDGKADPNNINDAALGAAVYLCVGGHDLSTEAGARAALMSYNRSTAYADQVLSIARAYSSSNPLSLLPNFPFANNPVAPLGPIGPRPPAADFPGGPQPGQSTPTPQVVLIGVERPPGTEPPPSGHFTPSPKPKPTPGKPPTKPTDPTDPTDPTNPTDPTDPTDPTTPTDPTDPTTPPTDPPPTTDPTPDPTPDPTTPPATDPPAPEPSDTAPQEPTTAEKAQAFCTTELGVSGETLQKCVDAYVAAAPNGETAAQDAARAAATA